MDKIDILPLQNSNKITIEEKFKLLRLMLDAYFGKMYSLLEKGDKIEEKKDLVLYQQKEEEIKNLKSIISAFEQKVDYLQKQLDNVNNNIKFYELLKRTFQQNESDLTNQNQQLKKQIEILQSQNISLLYTNQKLEKEINLLNNKINNLLNEIQNLTKEKETISQDLFLTQKKADYLQQKRRNTLLNFRKIFINKKLEINNLKNIISEFEKTIENLTKNAHKYNKYFLLIKDYRKKIRLENYNLNNKLNEMQNKIKDLTNFNDTVVKQLNFSQSKVEMLNRLLIELKNKEIKKTNFSLRAAIKKKLDLFKFWLKQPLVEVRF